MGEGVVKGRILWLDSLRGIAACVVANFWHYQHLGVGPLHSVQPFAFLYTFGYFGVDFFFILSGIVFSHVYLERIAGGIIRAGTFWRRRFARLYPLHLLTLLVAAGLGWWFWSLTGHPAIPRTTNTTREFIHNLLFLQGGVFAADSGFNTPSWSLTIEEIMYAVFFGLAWSGAGMWGWAALLGLGWWMANHLGADWVAPWFNLALARGLLGFGMGMGIYRTVFVKGWWLMGTVPLAVIILGPLYTMRMVPFVHCLFTTALIALWYAKPIQQALTARWLVWLGERSYTIYMIHVPIQMALLTAGALTGWTFPAGRLWFWGLYVTMVVGLADLTYRGFERPMRDLIRA